MYVMSWCVVLWNPLLLGYFCQAMFFPLPLNFVMYSKWQSCIGKFSQIWILAKYESTFKKTHPSLVLATYLNLV
jgi:hypothetical protein